MIINGNQKVGKASVYGTPREMKLSLKNTALKYRLEKIRTCCAPHLEFAWASFIYGMAADCDFRDAETVERYRQEMAATTLNGDKDE